ncbi:MAG: ABC transporter permease [Bacteroidetes Order II. Incertae sedis bacterium]|nr:ABC transporter permease [Bacteroidetes Order II. bacterium]
MINRQDRPTGAFGSLRRVFVFRELLINLTRHELRLRYKNSILGFVWSLLNPLLYLVIYSVVFQEILRTQIPLFAIFLLSGLLIWNFLAASLSAGAGSIINNSSIVQKVWFPREVLPLASVGAALIHFFLQSLVLTAALFVFRQEPDWVALALVPFALLTIVLFASAGALSLSALNVYYRDVQHLLEVTLLAWFWLTPIVYNHSLVASRLGSNDWVSFLNPVTSIVLLFQRALHNPPPGYIPDVSLWYYFRNVSIIFVFSLISFVLALRLFQRLDNQLAERI